MLSQKFKKKATLKILNKTLLEIIIKRLQKILIMKIFISVQQMTNLKNFIKCY